MMVPGLLTKELSDVAVEVFSGPPRPGEKPVDVAVVTLRERLHAILRPLATGLDSIAADDVVDTGDGILLAGFPCYLGNVALGPGHRAWMGRLLTYETEVTGKDEIGRLKLAWNTAVPLHDSRPLPHVHVTPGAKMELGDPQGASGGGIWRVRRKQEGELIWSPTSHARLIGIQSAHTPKLETAYAESVVLWRSWLQEIVGRIDGSGS